MLQPSSTSIKPHGLDTLAPANGFAHENAHDALADVEATIYMARLIRDRKSVPRVLTSDKRPWPAHRRKPDGNH